MKVAVIAHPGRYKLSPRELKRLVEKLVPAAEPVGGDAGERVQVADLEVLGGGRFDLGVHGHSLRCGAGAVAETDSAEPGLRQGRSQRPSAARAGKYIRLCG